MNGFWWCAARGLAQRRRDEEDGRGNQAVICEKAAVDQCGVAAELYVITATGGALPLIQGE